MYDPSLGELPARRGRAARINTPNRFEPFHVEEDPSALEADELRQVETAYFVDDTKSILAKNESPDVGFTYSINPYRGCEHGCIYCYARPSHEYLGFSAGLDFETKILVKERAPVLLSAAFQKPSWDPQVVALSGNTDPYQPIDRRLELTRRCLEVFLKHRNPVAIITKNYLVTRDVDVLEEMARLNLVTVALSITTLRSDLVGVMEPRTSRPGRRLQAIEELARRGIPTSVNVAPVVPGLTDEEMPAILEAAADRGASRAAYIMLRLPGPVTELFLDWLSREFPDRVNKVVHRLESLRRGDLSDSRFGVRMRGEGEWSDLVRHLFHVSCRKYGLNASNAPLSTDGFRRLRNGQRSLFD
ncbi:MAG: PA0069 family radical SAM protein [Rhodothermales bacterium]